MGLTENFSPTYLSTGNPCLDFFFHVVPDTPAGSLVDRLASAWAHDPLTTLKLIGNLRGVRGMGKSDKQGFYTAALWLHDHHPKTLALNARAFSELGYFKDYVEILYRLLEGPDARKKAKKGEPGKKVLDAADPVSVRARRKEREIAKAAKALKRYNSDPDYRFLFDSTADLFADLLKSDMEALRSEDYWNISLAGKWCPSIDSSYDEHLLICEAIARRMFPKESDEQYQGIEEAHYAYRVRDRLRKEILVPLRKALEIPEVYMSAGEWSSLPYSRVPSVAMANYSDLFLKHDRERFQEYLEKVKSRKAKIAAGALLPHQIIGQLKHPEKTAVAELQWARLVDDMSRKGKLSNCIAVSDVSGSMKGTPMEVSVALGLLVSELSEEPWKGKVFTFSSDPELHLVRGETLMEKTEFIRTMDWGSNTDFQKVFDKILDSAVLNNLTEDQLVKRVFVFSDMEFDKASRRWWLEEEEEERKWETDYQAIQRKFREKGYNRVPEIVFWNLRDSSATPVVGTQNGVALVSGFSKNLLKVFMKRGGIVNCDDAMMLAIADEEYEKLVVYD
ncbi:unnamed protein product [Linum trigynum]|uniref:DUF2828 family protein n=1 Tax=Linum trigynum TaxID=586398 RepID=A0AAV2GGL5_9ROSI